MADKTLVQRAGTTEEIASIVTYIASDEASYITGSIVEVNGGSHL